MQLPKSNSGFTIVELLIVVVVIAILAAITIVAYNGVTSQAQDSATAATHNGITRKLQANQITNTSGSVVNRNSNGSTPLTVEQFTTANGLTGINNKICYKVVNYSNDDYYADPCYPSHVVGSTPAYDKKLVYVFVELSNDSNIKISNWSNKQNAWLGSNLFADGSGNIINSDWIASTYQCAPFTTMQYFQSGCRYIQNDL